MKEIKFLAALGQNISVLRYFTQQKRDFELLIALRGKMLLLE